MPSERVIMAIATRRHIAMLAVARVTPTPTLYRCLVPHGLQNAYVSSLRCVANMFPVEEYFEGIAMTNVSAGGISSSQLPRYCYSPAYGEEIRRR